MINCIQLLLGGGQYPKYDLGELQSLSSYVTHGHGSFVEMNEGLY